MRTGRLFVAAVLCTVFATVSAAQETTGAITGRLRDSQNLALPGVAVTITGPQGEKTFTTDEEGRYHAPFLVPGVYTLRAELPGFKTFERRDIVVRLGQTVEISFAMAVGGIEEMVQVIGESPVVDVSKTTTGQVLPSEMFSRVPIGRTFADTLYMAPGVGSSGSAGRANPSIAGGTALDNQYVIDGVNVSNAGFGALGSYSIVFGSLGNATPFDFIKEVQVKTGGYEAEFGQSIGGVVNVITKSGSNTFRGSLFGYARLDALEANWKQYQSVNGSVQTLGSQVTDIGAESGGPVIENRLFFFGAVNPAWTTRSFEAPEGFPLLSLGKVDRNRRTISYAVKGTWQVTPAHRVDASFFGDPSMGEMGPQRASSLLRETTSSFSKLDEYGGHNQTVRYDGVLSSKWLVEASFARAYNTIVETPSVDEWFVTDYTVIPNVVTGGIGYYDKGNEGENFQFSAKSTNIIGDHMLRYGVQYEDVSYDELRSRTGPTFTAPDGRTTATGASISILSDPVYERIYRVTRANFSTGRATTQTYWSVFAQDSWRINDRLTVNPGLRYEQQTLNGMLVEGFELKNNWAPRIGATYDVVGNGRSKVYGNYGRFFARVPNDLAVRALSADEGMTRADYFDAQLTQPVPDGVLAAGQTNHYLLSGMEASVVDPDAGLSFKDEYVFGFEYEVLPATNLGVRYIHRGIGRVLEDIAPFPLVAYDLNLEGTDSVEYILTNPTSETPTGAPELGARFEDPIHDYDAVEVTLDKRFTNNWMLVASYRWSRLHGTFEGFYREDNGQSDPALTSLYDFPTNDPSYTGVGTPEFGYSGDIRYLGALGKGPLPLDRPHQAKVFGSYSFDIGLSLGLGLTMSSGAPLTPLAANPYYDNGGEIPEAPRGSGIETIDGFKERTPFESQVDMQASYQLQLGRQKVTVLADIFNLFNQRRTTGYDSFTELSFEVPNPDFGRPISQNVSGQPPQFQAPFAMRIGVRFEW